MKKREKTPKNILILMQKGGVGKTFLADELCFYCDREEIPYCFRDYDGQGGSAHTTREVEDPEWIITDTRGDLNKNTREWIAEADLIIVPTVMAKGSLDTTERMLRILEPWVKEKHKEVLVVFNMRDRYTTCRGFEGWFNTLFPTWDTVSISLSEVIKQASNYEESVCDYRKRSKSAREVSAFCEAVVNKLKK